ncbi:Inosine monophosphate dehydrogenase [Mycena sanguinolenta]|uniref:Inosine monophosphate dehydrogenase n=1 Tax=Mycena sanguinolenta TaxID=230812 RepID=A0A8H6TWV8_9AGAR|nr:Inosine monophosphate dehydrogenase [Mycena sanguinolenta]
MSAVSYWYLKTLAALQDMLTLHIPRPRCKGAQCPVSHFRQDSRRSQRRCSIGARCRVVRRQHRGTRFMYTVESPIHKNIKRIIVASSEQDTAHIIHTPYNTPRVFKNKASTEVVQIEPRPGGAKFENVRELVSGQRGKVVYENDDPDYGIWTTWYIAMGLITDIPTCDELLKTLEKGTEDIVTNMSTVVVKSKV